MSQGRIERQTIDSHFLGEERTVWIYLPPEYDPETAYPVLYAHDGEDYLRMGRIRTIVNKQLEAGEMEPLVIVGIPVEKKYRTSEYTPQGDRHQAYLSFVTEELIPTIEGSAEGVANVKERGVIGSSLGGLVACQLAWQNNGLFDKVISQSGAFYNEKSTEALQARDPKELSGDYYVMVGTEETDVSTSAGTVNFLEANRQLKDLLKGKALSVYYKEENGNHTWGLWQQNLPHALHYFWGVI